MSGNIIGKVFRVMTFGESHGPFVGLVIDGIKPGEAVDTELIQKELDRRRPGQSDLTTTRREEDRAQIISGVLDGKTTGTPLCILIKNRDQKPQDYHGLDRILRPGHAGYSYLQKYGVFDFRGGGRASGRETASRVAAGALAKQFLSRKGIRISAYTIQIGQIGIESVDYEVIEKNPVRAPDLSAAKKMEEAILKAKEEGDSLGGVIEIVVENCPAGLGEPVFNKIEADLASALMSIGAVTAFEMGSGFKSARQKGSEHNDRYYYDDQENRIRTKTNNAGGTLGGISNGENLVMRLTVKPPSSIRMPQETVDRKGKHTVLKMAGRHDSCICPRIVPVAEAMVALVLIDHLLLQDRIAAVDKPKQLEEQMENLDRHLLLMLAQRHLKLNEIKEILPDESDQQKIAQKLELRRQKIFKVLNLPESFKKDINNILAEQFI